MPDEKKNEEKRLIDGCKRGDRSSQKRLFEKYYAMMLAICLRYAQNEEDAKDLLQEGFAKIFLKIKQFKENERIRAWMKTIMVNTAIDKYRSEINKPYQTEVNDSDTTGDLDQELMEYFNIQDITELIQNLPDNCRTVFNLFAIEGYSHDEIAEMLDIKASTSRSQLNYARKQLQSRILKIREKDRK